MLLLVLGSPLWGHRPVAVCVWALSPAFSRAQRQHHIISKLLYDREKTALDVHFVNPLPVMQRLAYRVWVDTKRVRIVEAES